MEAVVSESSPMVHDFLEAMVRQAWLDADGVTELLRASGVQRQSPDGGFDQLGLPAEMLLGLGLAIRLRRWELHKISAHVDAGLPTSDEVFERVFYECHGPTLSDFVTRTYTRTLQIHSESFLWRVGDCDQQCDLAIVGDEDQGFFQAVAQFLWAQAKKEGGS